MSEQVEVKAEVVDVKAENLKLWHSVGKTNPNFTKVSTQKGGFTSINPYYQIEQATGLWGVFGKNWGLRSIVKDFSQIELTGLMLYQAEFFCPETTFEINNAVSVKSVGKGYVDEDFMKKVETDTLTKALSKVGFNNDIFKAQFDNAEYLEERKAEVEMETAEDKEKLNEERFKEVATIANNAIKAMSALSTTITVDNLKNKTLTTVRRKLNAYKFQPELLDKRLIDAAQKRIDEIRGIQANDKSM